MQISCNRPESTGHQQALNKSLTTILVGGTIFIKIIQQKLLPSPSTTTLTDGKGELNNKESLKISCALYSNPRFFNFSMRVVRFIPKISAA